MSAAELPIVLLARLRNVCAGGRRRQGLGQLRLQLANEAGVRSGRRWGHTWKPVRCFALRFL